MEKAESNKKDKVPAEKDTENKSGALVCISLDFNTSWVELLAKD